MERRMKVAVTHDGIFHADDVFAAVVVRRMFPRVRIIRTRHPDHLAAADLRFDVGGKSDGATDFDHHQPGGAGVRPNGVPYAAAGLVWHAFGERIAGSAAVASEVDRGMIQSIDAHDNGYALTTPFANGVVMTVSHAISSLNPAWHERPGFDAHFAMALDMATILLDRAIVRAVGIVQAEREVMVAIQNADDPRILVLDRFLPWQETVCTLAPTALFVVFPSAGTWRVQGVPQQIGMPGNRRSLPAAWAGLEGSALQAITGVSEATFAHRGLFIAGAASKAGAYALAQKALQ